MRVLSFPIVPCAAKKVWLVVAGNSTESGQQARDGVATTELGRIFL